MTDKRDFELARDAHIAIREQQIDANRATVDAGTTALRAVFLLNGGATVALLAFAANIAATDDLGIWQSIVGSVWTFSLGVVAAATASCTTYLTNYCYVSSFQAVTRIWDFPFLEQTAKSNRWRRVGLGFHVLTVLLAFSSLAFFVTGSYSLSQRLSF